MHTLCITKNRTMLNCLTEKIEINNSDAQMTTDKKTRSFIMLWIFEF